MIDNVELREGGANDSNCGDVSCGGSIYIGDAATVTINQSRLTYNRADDGRGAGIFVRGTLNVYFSSIDNNKSHWGGGIYAEDAVVNVYNSSIAENIGRKWGGAVYAEGGEINIYNSTIPNNSGYEEAGGIYTDTPTTLVNVTFGYNYTREGKVASIYLASETAPLYLYNTLLIEAAVAHCRDGFGTVIVINSLADDTSCPNTTSTTSYSIVDFSPKDNGGPTETFALLEGNLAIDAGDNAICEAAPINGLDQRGSLRPAWGTCDIGAYEFEDDAVCQAAPINNVDQRGLARSQGAASDIGAVEMQMSELGGTAVSLSNSLSSSNLTLFAILGGMMFLGIAGVVIRQRQA
ncbi:MAG: choice-of-anchor Q domain-containing protein [Chloroflexota bacterium]